MLIAPFLRINLQPRVYSWVNQTRNVRPIIKIGKDRFQLSVDVHHFKKDELRVKACAEHVIIEGKQEMKTQCGCVMRHFVRKFRLPNGCNPKTIKSELSPNGFLTITAPIKPCDVNMLCETRIPITTLSKEDELQKDKKVESPDKKCPPT